MYLDVTIKRSRSCHFTAGFDGSIDICATPNYVAEICPGDLGGPLMCKDQLVGIIGGTYGCSGNEGMKFINFTHVADWVEKVVLSLSSSGSYGLCMTLFVVCQLHYHLMR